MICTPYETPLQKTKFSFVSGYPLYISSGLGVGFWKPDIMKKQIVQSQGCASLKYHSREILSFERLYYLTTICVLGVISVCGIHTRKVLHTAAFSLNSVVFNAVHACFQQQTVTFRVQPH